MSTRANRPRKPPRPRVPEIFKYEEIVVVDDGQWKQLKHEGRPTLGEIISIIPEDIPLDEVLIRTRDYGSDITYIYFQRITLVENAEEKIQEYRKKVEQWAVEMAEHRDEIVAWIRKIREEEKAGLPEKRKRLIDIKAEASRIEEELKAAERAEHKRK